MIEKDRPSSKNSYFDLVVLSRSMVNRTKMRNIDIYVKF